MSHSFCWIQLWYVCVNKIDAHSRKPLPSQPLCTKLWNPQMQLWKTNVALWKIHKSCIAFWKLICVQTQNSLQEAFWFVAQLCCKCTFRKMYRRTVSFLFIMHNVSHEKFWSDQKEQIVHMQNHMPWSLDNAPPSKISLPTLKNKPAYTLFSRQVVA